MLDTMDSLIMIVVVAIATFSTRAFSFIIFPKGKEVPPAVSYLGKVLTPAIIGMLVIYCLKNVQLLQGSHGLPELIGILVTALLHFWKKQMLLSVAGGTVCYMLLVQLVF